MSSRDGECDCCGKWAALQKGWVTGIETYACAGCHGYEPDEFDDEPAAAILGEKP